MWECIRCKHFFLSSRVQPGIDDFGIYFICPHCQRRNTLESYGEDDTGALVLVQKVQKPIS